MTQTTWRQRLKPLVFTLHCTVVVVAVIATLRAHLPYELALNTTASIPRGLYLAKDYKGGRLERGQEACFEYRAPAWAAERNYFAQGRRLCKYIAGLPGDRLESSNGTLTVYPADGSSEVAARYAQADSAGRPLPQGSLADGEVPAGKVLMLAPAKPNSLDSRYLGLVNTQALTHTLTPIFLID